MNATAKTKNEYLIAPYLATSQMASLYQQKLVNVCIGSHALLGFDLFEQAIVDFDLEAKTFTYVVREELKTEIADLQKLIVDDGLVYQKPKNEEAKTELLWHL